MKPPKARTTKADLAIKPVAGTEAERNNIRLANTASIIVEAVEATLDQSILYYAERFSIDPAVLEASVVALLRNR